MQENFVRMFYIESKKYPIYKQKIKKSALLQADVSCTLKTEKEEMENVDE